MKKTLIVEIISFLFILLFVYAALAKLRDVEQFKMQIGQSPLLIAFSSWIAWVVPIVELVVAGLLVVHRFRLIGLIGAFTLMVTFTVYIIVILTYADHVPCSCGGILEKMGWTEHLIFNIGFVLLSLVGIFILTRQEEGQHPIVA